MIINYLKIFIRNFMRRKTYSFINVLGLSLGLMSCILILLWVQDEVSYDKFNTNAQELHLIAQNQNFATGKITVERTPPAVAPALKKDYPEIIETARLTYIDNVLNYGDKSYYEQIHFADPAIFNMFTFKFIKGSPAGFSEDISSMVITEEMARKYFGDEDPMGKILKLSAKIDFKVAAVINIPRNSSVKFNFLISIQYLKKWGFDLEEWGASSCFSYALLRKGASYKDVSKKIADLFRRYKAEDNIREPFLHPLTRLRLYSITGEGGRIKYVRLFSLVALFILIIACINFMNLATACSTNRAREVGIRKVAGAHRFNLIKQFFSESLFMLLIALILAIVGVKLMLPFFNALSGKQLTMSFIASKDIILILIGITVFTGLLAGGYPAVFLSSFRPANVLKGLLKAGGKGAWLRKTLVVAQFAISVILIICTMVVFRQLDYIRNKDIGLDKENVIYISSRGSIGNQYETVKTELLKNPNVLAVTISSDLPSNISSETGGWEWEGENSSQKVLMGFGLFGYDYPDTFKIPMAQGRFYSKEFTDDQSLVVNEKAVEVMGLKEPIGKRISFIGKNFKIIGVAKDFHFKSLHHEIKPLVMMLDGKMIDGFMGYNHIFIRIGPKNVSDTLQYIENIYRQFAPGFLFEYRFLDEEFDELYQSEKQMGKIFGAFAFLAVLISCLGLLGLASFMVERRTKEIAVRKVVGASIPSIVMLLSTEFSRLVVAANILAWPIAYFAMNKWLQGFVYRASVNVWILLFAAALSLVIALLMVSFRTVKVALTNPVESLKYE